MGHFLILFITNGPVEQANIDIAVRIIMNILIFEIGDTREEGNVKDLIHGQDIFMDVED